MGLFQFIIINLRVPEIKISGCKIDRRFATLGKSLEITSSK